MSRFSGMSSTMRMRAGEAIPQLTLPRTRRPSTLHVKIAGSAMNARAYLESLIHFGQKFGLDTIHALCAALGHPERAYPTLLVAGTNGKGSVVAYLDHALRAAGRRV